MHALAWSHTIAQMAGALKLHLYTTPFCWNLPSNSPACAKLETWLRMAGVEYDKPALDLARAPKGKIPFVGEGEGDDEVLMGDSTLIIEHLRQTRGVDLDAALSARDRAISLAFRRMLKENVYWAAVVSRYSSANNWALYGPILGAAIVPDGSAEVQMEAAEDYRKMILGTAHAHGLGRHSMDEIALIFKQDVDALSELLGDNEWMMGGEEPTTLDATVFGYVGNFIDTPYSDPCCDYARTLSNLDQLCERIRARYFPELVDVECPRPKS